MAIERSSSQSRQLWLLVLLFLILNALLASLALLFIPPETVGKLQAGVFAGEPGTRDDFLKIFLPMFIALSGFLVGFLGLKRLEQFDVEINNLRQHLSQQVTTERQLAAQERSTFRAGVSESLSDFKSAVQSLAEQYVGQAFDEKSASLRSLVGSSEISMSELVTKIEEQLQPYAWLEEKKQEVDFLVGILTMGTAHERSSRFFAEGKPDISIRICEYAIREELSGDPDDFHNLAADMASNQIFSLANSVVNVGLKNYPENVDLLADAIKYRCSVGSIDMAGEAYRRLQNIPTSRWNWRAFVFSGDYFELIGRVEDAEAVYESFREHIPMDERAYSQPGTYYYQLGRYNKAISILKIGVEKCPRAAQCALMLAKAYVDVGEYDKAVAAATVGIEATAEEQPSVNPAAILWARAKAYDSLIHRSIAERQAGNPGWQVDDEIYRLALECISDYRSALQLRDALSYYQRRGPQRVVILLDLLSRLGLDADRFQSLNSIAEEISSSARMPVTHKDLLALLSSVGAEKEVGG